MKKNHFTRREKAFNWTMTICFGGSAVSLPVLIFANGIWGLTNIFALIPFGLVLFGAIGFIIGCSYTNHVYTRSGDYLGLVYGTEAEIRKYYGKSIIIR